jgi:hypothetical protein
MLELLNQLDGFTNQTTVKIIAATNRRPTGRKGLNMGHGMNPAGRWFFGLYIGISR